MKPDLCFYHVQIKSYDLKQKQLHLMPDCNEIPNITSTGEFFNFHCFGKVRYSIGFGQELLQKRNVENLGSQCFGFEDISEGIFDSDSILRNTHY